LIFDALPFYVKTRSIASESDFCLDGRNFRMGGMFQWMETRSIASLRIKKFIFIPIGRIIDDVV
jgi:hypothetical protein